MGDSATHIEVIIFPPQPVEQQMPVDLRLDQDQVDEEDDKVMFDVFVGEAVALRTLGQAHALAQGAVVGLAVLGV
jgi:hypothetical protein